ncbi:hypothetical protein ABHI18_012190, partial [Aspergillus niger]
FVPLSFKGGIVRSEGREDEKLPKVNFGQLLVHYAENDVSVDYQLHHCPLQSFPVFSGCPQDHPQAEPPSGRD